MNAENKCSNCATELPPKLLVCPVCRSPTGFRKRRALQTALADGALGCLAVVTMVVVGIVIDATMGPQHSKFLVWLGQGVWLVSSVGIIRALYVLVKTPWSLTKEALHDREFWRLWSRVR